METYYEGTKIPRNRSLSEEAKNFLAKARGAKTTQSATTFKATTAKQKNPNAKEYEEMEARLAVLQAKSLKEASEKFYSIAAPRWLKDKRLSTKWEKLFRERIIELNILNPAAPANWRLEQGQLLIDGKIWNGKEFIELEKLSC